MLKEIEALNKKIDSLMVERTKAEAQKGLLQSNLEKSIKEYASEYGVDLSADSLEGISAKFNEEAKKVQQQVKEEYEMAKKLVECIDRKDYDGAWALLGVTKGTVEVEDVTTDVATDTTVNIDDVSDDDLFGTTVTTIHADDPLGTLGRMEEMVRGTEVTTEVKVEKPTPTTNKPSTAPLFSLDDEDEDIPTLDTQSSSNSSSFEVDDEEDDGDNFSLGGFSDLLKGTQFEVK